MVYKEEFGETDKGYTFSVNVNDKDYQLIATSESELELQ